MLNIIHAGRPATRRIDDIIRVAGRTWTRWHVGEAYAQQRREKAVDVDDTRFKLSCRFIDKWNDYVAN